MIIQLYRLNSGTDGWDSRTELAHVFTSRDKAIEWLTSYGYTYVSPYNKNRYEHEDVAQRHCMGQISFEIKEVETPIDPAPNREIRSTPFKTTILTLKTAIRNAFQREASSAYPPAKKRTVESDAIDALIRHAFSKGFLYGANSAGEMGIERCLKAFIDNELSETNACCTNEMRTMDGGCVNCGAPCL